MNEKPKAPAAKAGASDKIETLARDVFVWLVRSPHSDSYEASHLATRAIQTAEAFYEAWTNYRAASNGNYRQD
jgi:hypothetical protein